MRKPALFLLVSLLAYWPLMSTAQQSARPTYMQIFYEGSTWLSGQRVLSYSPAFRGKTGELVQEPDSVRQVSPAAFMQGPAEFTTTTAYATVSTEKGTFITDRNGKVHLETAADRKLARQQEQNRLNRSLKLLVTRADLGRAALTKALNETAADGWEIVQMTSSGAPGGLVYLLQRR